MSQLTAIGEDSLQRWGTMVLSEYADQLIPVHGPFGKFPYASVPIFGGCRCRIIAGQWVYEPDACDYCKALGDDWNSVIQMPASVETSS